MKRLTQCASIFAALAVSTFSIGAATDTLVRLVAFETSSLPKVYGIIDTRPGTGGPKEISAPDFRLLEDGKSSATGTRTLRFRETDAGLALVVAIDVSPSMDGRPLQAIRRGLAEMVSRKRERDRVSVLTFAGDVRWETRWDAAPDTTRKAFEDLRTRGDGTRLYDAVGQALDELASQAKADTGFPTRACILVLSDGHDEGSRAGLGQVANRLRASRVRLDAVGLAHFPLWLRSLQVLSNAGFGGFRTASSPEDLTRLLGQGVDLLLDVPAIEFNADRISRDGKPHQFGIEYLPGHWRDQLAVTLPEASWKSDWRVWSGLGFAVLLLAVSFFYLRSNGRRPAMAAAVATPPVPAAQVTSYRRGETVGETSAVPALLSQPPPAIRPAPVSRPAMNATTAEPRSPEPQTAQKAARVGTMLAPQNSGRAIGSLAAAAGPYAGQRFPLSADEFWIGSGTNNHLCLGADPAVSGNHACIRREEGLLRIYDNESMNNTMVNGRLVGRDVVLLNVGDRIRIGQSELCLEP